MLYLSRALNGHKEQEYFPPPMAVAWLLTTSENTGGQLYCEAGAKLGRVGHSRSEVEASMIESFCA